MRVDIREVTTVNKDLSYTKGIGVKCEGEKLNAKLYTWAGQRHISFRVRSDSAPQKDSPFFQLMKDKNFCYRGIHADVIVYIFAHLQTTLRTEENLFDIYWIQAAKELVKLNTWLKF